MKPTFQTFGWQHFQFQIPSDWDLVEEHGNEDKGYFQLADLERPRLEMKWQKISSHLLFILVQKLKLRFLFLRIVLKPTKIGFTFVRTTIAHYQCKILQRLYL